MFFFKKTYRYYVMHPFASEHYKRIYGLKEKSHAFDQKPSHLLSAADLAILKKKFRLETDDLGGCRRFWTRLMWACTGSCSIPCHEVLQELSQAPDVSLIYEMIHITAQVTSVALLIFSSAFVDSTPSIECYDCALRPLWYDVMAKDKTVTGLQIALFAAVVNNFGAGSASEQTVPNANEDTSKGNDLNHQDPEFIWEDTEGPEVKDEHGAAIRKECGAGCGGCGCSLCMLDNNPDKDKQNPAAIRAIRETKTGELPHPGAKARRKQMEVMTAHFGQPSWDSIENVMIISHAYWSQIKKAGDENKEFVFKCKIELEAWQKHLLKERRKKISSKSELFMQPGFTYEDLLGVKLRKVINKKKANVHGGVEFFVQELTTESPYRPGQLGRFCVGDQIIRLSSYGPARVDARTEFFLKGRGGKPMYRTKKTPTGLPDPISDKERAKFNRRLEAWSKVEEVSPDEFQVPFAMQDGDKIEIEGVATKSILAKEPFAVAFEDEAGGTMMQWELDLHASEDDGRMRQFSRFEKHKVHLLKSNTTPFRIGKQFKIVFTYVNDIDIAKGTKSHFAVEVVEIDRKPSAGFAGQGTLNYSCDPNVTNDPATKALYDAELAKVTPDMHWEEKAKLKPSKERFEQASVALVRITGTNAKVHTMAAKDNGAITGPYLSVPLGLFATVRFWDGDQSANEFVDRACEGGREHELTTPFQGSDGRGHQFEGIGKIHSIAVHYGDGADFKRLMRVDLASMLTGDDGDGDDDGANDAGWERELTAGLCELLIDCDNNSAPAPPFRNVPLVVAEYTRKYAVLCDKDAIDASSEARENIPGLEPNNKLWENTCFKLASGIQQDNLSLGTVFSYDVVHKHTLVRGAETRQLRASKEVYDTIELRWDYATHTRAGMEILECTSPLLFVIPTLRKFLPTMSAHSCEFFACSPWRCPACSCAYACVLVCHHQRGRSTGQRVGEMMKTDQHGNATEDPGAMEAQSKKIKPKAKPIPSMRKGEVLQHICSHESCRQQTATGGDSSSTCEGRSFLEEMNTVIQSLATDNADFFAKNPEPMIVLERSGKLINAALPAKYIKYLEFAFPSKNKIGVRVQRLLEADSADTEALESIVQPGDYVHRIGSCVLKKRMKLHLDTQMCFANNLVSNLCGFALLRARCVLVGPQRASACCELSLACPCRSCTGERAARVASWPRLGKRRKGGRAPSGSKLGASSRTSRASVATAQS